jgi:hypothetical protein
LLKPAHDLDVDVRCTFGMKHLLLTISIFFLFLGISAQDQKDHVICDAIIENGDTIPVVMLGSAVVSQSVAYNKKFQKRYNRLEPKIIKAYPYAEAAGQLMQQYEAQLNEIESDNERKKFLKKAEKELMQQFEGELTNLTISEGMILIKLIDRETGDTSFQLIQELKGNFSAWMWQGLARLFGHNLKNDYDAEGDELIIEEVVRRIENGEIHVDKKQVSLAGPVSEK